MNKKRWFRRRKKLFKVREVGNDLDYAIRAYDFFRAFNKLNEDEKNYIL